MRRVWSTITKPPKKVTLAIFGVGLLATTCELFLFGAADISTSLTYAGRMTGVVFLLAALLALGACIAFLNYCTAQPAKYSGALTFLGVMVSLLANLTLLILQIDGGYTGILWVWITFLLWAGWALWQLHRSQVWSGIPYPRTFAAGVAITSLLAVANFSYTLIYQPYTSPALISTRLEFGKAKVHEGTVVLPLRVHTKNMGKVGVYVLGSLYQVAGRIDAFSKDERSTRMWLQDVSSRQPDLYRHTDIDKEGYHLLAQGRFLAQGSVLQPGREIVSEKVIQLPAAHPYDLLGATGSVAYIRRDRATLADDYASSGKSSWRSNFTHTTDEREAPAWVAKSGVETFKYQSRIIHSSALLEKTRPPHNVTVWWVLTNPGSESQFGPQIIHLVAKRGTEAQKPTPAERRRMTDRYGLDITASGNVQKSVQELIESRQK
ncbi:hypothetical protein ACQEV2_28330 [Streptomyces sp. CA-251387]|uniref:hypothetical protein n=1 Tax=Streptomyces sp. CA-251387 TaxID=3240064 RepID=UPI003D89E279